MFHQRQGRFLLVICLTLIVALLAIACGQKSSEPLDPAVVVDIVGTTHSTFLITDNGDLWATGLNKYGELAIGQQDRRLVKVTPVPPIGSGTPVYPSYRIDPGYLPAPVRVARNIKQAAITAQASAYVTNDGELWVMGYENSLKYFPEVRQALANQTRGLIQNDVTRPVKVMDDVKKIVAAAHFLILQENGNLYGAGDNTWGELGSAHMISDPLLIDRGVTDVFVGDGMTFYLKGDGQLYSCGRNIWGELGFGDPLGVDGYSANLPPQVTMNIPPQVIASDVQSVYYNEYYVPQGPVIFTLLLKTDGELYMLGKNFENIYEDGSEYATTPRHIASNVRKIGVATLETHEQALLILNNDDQLLGWGSNFTSLGVENTGNQWVEIVTDVKDFWTTPNLFVLTNGGQMRAVGPPIDHYQDENIGQLGAWSWD